MTHLIVGLGNPGKKYEHNRHNVGFMAVDAIVNRYGAQVYEKKSGKWSALWNKASQGSWITDIIINNHTHYVSKSIPSFMNNFGEAVADAVRVCKITTDHVIIFHDDLDLPLGKVRVKSGGSSGGHNGLKSIDSRIGKDYWRVRIGIGHPGDKDLVSDYVLDNFEPQEETIIAKLISAIVEHISLLLQGDEAGFMNKISLATKDTK